VDQADSQESKGFEGRNGVCRGRGQPRGWWPPRRSPRLAARPVVAVAAATLGLVLLAAPARAQVALNLYGNADYHAMKDSGQTTNAFGTALADVFLSGTKEKLSYLAEFVFEVGDNNEFAVDVERLQLGYQVTEWFRVAAGRFHTAFGYINDSYHHGAYYLLSTGRPTFVNFEDGGGLIPAHSVGLHIDGRFHLGSSRLRYDAELANGRAATSDQVTNRIDPNNGKAVNLRLRLEPGGVLDGLVFGGNVYLDTIDTTDALMVPVRMSEQAYGAHLAYMEHNVHLISETALFRHVESNGGPTHQTVATFVELGYSFAELTPYARYERTSFGSGPVDPYWAAGAAARGSFHVVTGGLNYLASDSVALKLEGKYQHFDSNQTSKGLSAQVAYAF